MHYYLFAAPFLDTGRKKIEAQYQCVRWKHALDWIEAFVLNLLRLYFPFKYHYLANRFQSNRPELGRSTWVYSSNSIRTSAKRYWNYEVSRWIDLHLRLLFICLQINTLSFWLFLHKIWLIRYKSKQNRRSQCAAIRWLFIDLAPVLQVTKALTASSAVFKWLTKKWRERKTT